MTGRIEKTVFISYRRTNVPWALAIYQELMHHGYDVFFDFQSIDSGNFEKVILENIKTRAHFLVILTPSALDRCKDPGDWLRREIETAMDEKRNIVPLMLESFDFGSPLIIEALSGKLSALNKFNGLRVYSEYFFEAMDKLRDRYLNIEVSGISLSSLNPEAKEITETQKSAANEASLVEEEQLSAQEWHERGYKYYQSENLDEAIRCHTEAVRLDPRYAFAYFSRGYMLEIKGDLDGAMRDYDKAIQLEPELADGAPYYAFRGTAYLKKDDAESAVTDLDKAIQINPDYSYAYYSRARAHEMKNDLVSAIIDYDEAIHHKPDDAVAYNDRGSARYSNNDFQGGLLDYDEAIRLDPDYVDAYNNRGSARADQSDLDGAIKDFIEVICLKPNSATAYYNRALTWEKKDDHSAAIADYQKYLDLGGGLRDGDQKKVEEKIKKLKSKPTRKKSVKKKAK